MFSVPHARPQWNKAIHMDDSCSLIELRMMI